MKKVNPNEKHTFHIHLKQFVSTIHWDDTFKQYIQGCQTKTKFGSIEFHGTESEFDAYLAAMPTDESQFKVIGVTNESDVLIEANDMGDGNVSVRIFENDKGDNQFRFTTKNVLSEMFTQTDDNDRMEANFKRGIFFRTWIRRNDFESITKMKFHNNEK